MPNKTFFHRNLKFWGLNRLFGRINFGAFGVFLADLSAPILVLWVSFPCFPLINHYFLKKSRLYIQITIIHLGLRLESGPQRIKGFSHLVFVVHAFGGFTSFFVHFFSFFLGCSALQTSSFRSFARHCVEINFERVELKFILCNISKDSSRIWALVGLPGSAFYSAQIRRGVVPPLPSQFRFPRCNEFHSV